LSAHLQCQFDYYVSSPNVCSPNGQFAYFVSFPSLTLRFREGETYSPELGKGETCPAGLGRGKHAWQGQGGGDIPRRFREGKHASGGLLGQVRLG